MQLWLMIPYFPKVKLVVSDIKGQIRNFKKGVVNQRKREKHQDHFIKFFFTDCLYLSASIISHCHCQPISISTKALKSKTPLLSQLSPSGLSLSLSLFAWDTVIGQTTQLAAYPFIPPLPTLKKNTKKHTVIEFLKNGFRKTGLAKSTLHHYASKYSRSYQKTKGLEGSLVTSKIGFSLFLHYSFTRFPVTLSPPFSIKNLTFSLSLSL